MTPEFARPQRLDTIGDARDVAIEADADERAALARRFDLAAVDRLAATLTLRREAAGIRVEGRVTADVVQTCGVTDARVSAHIDEPVALRFVDALDEAEEVELDAGALDTVEIEGGAIDLGEVAAETMALALDPFPRAPGAEAELKAAGVLSEEEARPANPFAALREKD